MFKVGDVVELYRVKALDDDDKDVVISGKFRVEDYAEAPGISAGGAWVLLAPVDEAARGSLEFVVDADDFAWAVEPDRVIDEHAAEDLEARRQERRDRGTLRGLDLSYAGRDLARADLAYARTRIAA